MRAQSCTHSQGMRGSHHLGPGTQDLDEQQNQEQEEANWRLRKVCKRNQRQGNATNPVLGFFLFLLFIYFFFFFGLFNLCFFSF